MKAKVWVNQLVEVTIDEKKFDKKFMESFRNTFYDFDDISDHIKHLAQLQARGFENDFIEGYGSRDDMGIQLEVIDQDEEFA